MTSAVSSILVLTRFRPDRPAGGAALRNWQNIQALARLAPVDVLSIAEPAGEDGAEPSHVVRRWIPFHRERLRARRSFPRRIQARLWFLRPGIHPAVDAYRFQDVTAWLTRQAAERRYDLAVIEELSLSGYVDDLKRAGCRVVFDAHNVESALRAEMQSLEPRSSPGLRMRVSEWLLRRRLTQQESRAVCRADLVWACSDVDADAIRRLYGRQRGVTVVPNGVNVDLYAAAGAADVGAAWEAAPMTLVYPGSFSYRPNVEAALRLVREVLPRVRARGIDARVVLVGRSPAAAMLALAKEDPAVLVTGLVPSILPYLATPCLVVLPIMLGSGTRLKILEAFAASRPVISTAKGAEGIDARDGEHLLIRNEPDAMAAAAIDLWHSPARRRAIAAAALDLVRSRYSWAAAAQLIERSLGWSERAAAAPSQVPRNASIAADVQ
jgi:glycosyltransferase involved in cell wall biosynthesis